MLVWLRNPTGNLSPEAQFVLTRFSPIWEVLFPQVMHGLVAQLVWEVRWDGRKDRFSVSLDETAIAEEHARIGATKSSRADQCRDGATARSPSARHAF